MPYAASGVVSTGTKVPAGTVLDFAGSTPSGYLECDGSAVSRTTYADLFAAIGTTYGVGDGSTTFNVPDLRGRATIGQGTGAGLTARTMGQSVGQEAITDVPQHSHGVTDPGHGHTVSGTTYATAAGTANQSHVGGGSGGSFSGGTSVSAAATTTGIAVNNAGSASVDVMSPATVVRKIIKT